MVTYSSSVDTSGLVMIIFLNGCKFRQEEDHCLIHSDGLEAAGTQNSENK